MYSLILSVIVIIGLYFIYNQISTLNNLLENVVKILKNNKAIIKKNSDNIINEIDQVHTQSNSSIFNPETLLSKFLGEENSPINPSQVEEEESEEEESEEEENKKPLMKEVKTKKFQKKEVKN